MDKVQKSNTFIDVAAIAICILAFTCAMCYCAYKSGNAYNAHYSITVHTAEDRYLQYKDVTHLVIANRTVSFLAANGQHTYHNVLGYMKRQLRVGE